MLKAFKVKVKKPTGETTILDALGASSMDVWFDAAETFDLCAISVVPA